MKGNKLTGKIIKTMAITTVLIVAGGINSNVCTKAANQSDMYKLVWSDEFNGNELDTSIWNYNYGNGDNVAGWGNNELEYYTDDKANVKVQNGALIITARAEKDENGKTTRYTSGRLNTSGKASFKYGKMEARIKIPSVKGLWPAFWMLGQNEPKGWPYCGEIDILETWNTLQFAQGTVHWENELLKPGRDTYNAFSTQMKDKTQWHIYGMNWDENKIEFTLDNKVYGTYNLKGSDKSELKKEFYFIINCAVGGNLAYFAPDEDFVSADMMVDYVRVYRRAGDKGTMTARWTDKNRESVPKHNIIFKNGKKQVSKQTVLDGENYTISKVKKKGYKFEGWYFGKKKIKEGARAYKNMTIVPKWKKIKLKKAKVIIPQQNYKRYATVKISAKGAYDGIQVKIGKKSDFAESKVLTFGKFKSGKTYKVKARTYAIDSRGKKIYGKWSSAKKITIK
ncbi:MAG: glycoside hydrolase family 16 protein [Eubacterium sp.]|nr:glycoside hydrolase family 16 protein [Eubacterium sp.]